ncbi:MAG: ATP-binding cassette domain-containing protein [Pseudomonadota bacterium]
MIELRGVQLNLPGGARFTYDLSVATGVSLGVIGPSGAGKSTLLHLIAGFLQPVSGIVELEGVDHSRSDPSRRPVSMVFQANNLFDHLDVATNVGLGISPSFHRGAREMGRVSDALDRVGLGGFESRKVPSLSGGEAQRVALARALVRDRPILLLDEPFAALGPSMRRDFTQLVSAMQKEKQLTMLTVSHTPQELTDLCDELAFINDGTITARGPVETMLNGSSNSDLRDYLGHPAD